MKKSKMIKLVVMIGMGVFLTSCDGEDQQAIQKPEKITKTLSQETSPDLNYQIVDENSVVQGELWTNIDSSGRPHKDIIRIPVEAPLYDASFLVYSKEFANRYGYPESHVADMPAKLHLMEFRIKSMGMGNACYLNFLIDKGTGHFLEDRDFFHRFFELGDRFDHGRPMRLPRRVEGFREPREDIDFRINHGRYGPDGEAYFVDQTIFIAGQEYTPSKSRGGSYLTAFLLDYHGLMFKNLDYFSVSVGCHPLPLNNIRQPNSMLWVKKRGLLITGGAWMSRRKILSRCRFPMR